MVKWKDSIVLKDCLQTATLQGLPWKPFALQFLTDYRSTSHATTGIPHYKLLHGSQMRTKRHIINLPMSNEDKNDLRKKVKIKQTKVKEYTDRHRSALQSNFQPGDEVKVKKPWMIKKGEQRNTKPQKVMENTGPNTYLLEDGRNWNASSLSAVLNSVPPRFPPEPSFMDERLCDLKL